MGLKTKICQAWADLQKETIVENGKKDIENKEANKCHEWKENHGFEVDI